MKKAFLLILVVSVLLTSGAFAADGNSPFYGRWAGSEIHSIMHYDAILHYMRITKYTTSEYFVFNLYEGGGFGQGKLDNMEVYSGKWEIVDDHIRVPTSAITYVDVYYDSETDTLYTKDPKVIYVRLLTK